MFVLRRALSSRHPPSLPWRHTEQQRSSRCKETVVSSKHCKQTGLIRCTLVIIVRRSPVIDMSEHSWLRGLLCCPKSPPSSPHPWSGLQLSSSSGRFLLDLCECLASRSGASDATWIRSLFCETSEKRTGAKMQKKNWETW